VTDHPNGDGGLIAHGIDTTRPSIARVYDYFLGGKDNYESDRELYRQVMQIAPEAPEWARENRRWLGRVISWLAKDVGIDRFVDAGSGLPTAENTHQIAQAHNPAATVVYIDNDPSVIAHGRALLLDNDRTHFAAADLTRPADVLSDPAVVSMLSEGEPVALVMALMLHHIQDTDATREIVQQYVDALPSGSYLAITHACNPRDGGAVAELATDWRRRSSRRSRTSRSGPPRRSPRCSAGWRSSTQASYASSTGTRPKATSIPTTTCGPTPAISCTAEWPASRDPSPG